MKINDNRTLKANPAGGAKKGSGVKKGIKSSQSYNLLTVHPDIAKEWHPTKNAPLTPDKVTPGMHIKVWWMCDEGHEWEAPISHRRKVCPFCYSKKANKEYNLSVLYPGIASQWHPTKNGSLAPDKVSPGSGKKVWWKCEKGHEWRSRILNRKRGNGCPYCAGKKASKEYNLLALHPELARQWHPTKNGDLTPGKVTPGSQKKVWWRCVKGHEWRASAVSRVKGTGCPHCARVKVSKEYNLLVLHPGVARQWHPTKNAPLTPDKVTPGMNRKVWWKCDKGHEYDATISNRIKGRGCPYCAGRKASKEYNLLALYPEVARLWHPTKNGDLTPDKVTPGSIKKVWWKCDKGHEWKERIERRKKNCPFCFGRMHRKKKMQT